MIRDAANSDELYIKLRSQIKAGWPVSKSTLSMDLQMFYSFCDELSIEQGLILKGNRLFVPSAVRHAMLERAHSAHIGINGGIRKARFWPGMTADLTN